MFKIPELPVVAHVKIPQWQLWHNNCVQLIKPLSELWHLSIDNEVKVNGQVVIDSSGLFRNFGLAFEPVTFFKLFQHFLK